MKLLIIFSIIVFASDFYPQTKGYLLIIGGGSRPDYMMNRAIELAGGKDSKIVIIPNASGETIETAEYQAEQFRKLGVKNIDYLIFDYLTVDADSNIQKLNNTTGIFFSGGDQSRLTRDMLGTKLLEKVKEIYYKGGIISGTSAGAAIMSKVMITGNELNNEDSSTAFNSIKKNNIETVEGFGFIDKAVVDQHFIKRKRNNRLISVILENPELIGIGIDESTCIIVYPDNTFEVLGESQVIVYDPIEAERLTTDKNNNFSINEMKMHVLISGQKFDLNERKVFK